MGYEVRPFDPKSATRDEWAAFHRFRRIRHQEREPEDPVLEDAAVEEFLKSEDPESEELRFVVMDPEHPEVQVASLYYEQYRPGAPSYEENKHFGWAGISVVAPHRRRGIGHLLLAKAAALARERGKSLLIGDTDEDDGKGFVEAIGAQVALRSRQSRLRLDEVDWDMVEAWAAEGPERSPGTALEWVAAPMGDALAEEYCDLFTEVFNEMPFEDLDVGQFTFTPETVRQHQANMAKAGMTWFAATTRERDGALSGLTEMGYHPDEGTMLRQFMTGVGNAYRGRGLGKWLKAAMLLRVREEYPGVEVVVTGNATSNAPMLGINVRLGFKPHREGMAAQIALDDLEAYLRSKGLLEQG